MGLDCLRGSHDASQWDMSAKLTADDRLKSSRWLRDIYALRNDWSVIVYWSDGTCCRGRYEGAFGFNRGGQMPQDRRLHDSSGWSVGMDMSAEEWFEKTKVVDVGGLLVSVHSTRGYEITRKLISK